MKTITRIVCSSCEAEFDHTRDCRFDPYRCPKCGERHTADGVEEIALDPLPTERLTAEKRAVTGPKRPVWAGVEVYLIQSGSGYTKIGISKNPQKRMADLQVAAPLELKLLTSLEPTISAKQYESELHSRYEKYRTHNEWFDLPDAVLSDLIREFEAGGPSPHKTAHR